MMNLLQVHFRHSVAEKAMRIFLCLIFAVTVSLAAEPPKFRTDADGRDNSHTSHDNSR